MAPRGVKPKPTTLKLIAGNRGKRPIHPEVEPQFADEDTPEAPAYLSPIAQHEWNILVDELRRTGVLKKADRFIFGAYCQSLAISIEADLALAEERKRCAETGQPFLTIVTANGSVMQNPLIGIANVARRDAARYAVELGLTPSARTRVKVNPPAKAESKAAKYLA